MHTLQTTDVIVVSLVANGWGLFKISDPKLSPETAASGAQLRRSHTSKKNPDFKHDEQRIFFVSITQLVHNYITPTYPLETTCALLVNGSFSH